MSCPHRHPLNCLVPDYMLKEIAKRGTEEEREKALKTLGISVTFRTSRAQAEARRAAGGRRSMGALAGLAEPRVQRVIRDAAKGEDTKAPIVRREGDDDGDDPAVNEAYEYFGNTWDYFFAVHARDSIDNAGMTLDGVVHYSTDYDNAFWTGDQMVFGDGSGRLFTRLTQSLAVCAHELGHGVIQYDGPLVYQGQAGALNEHLADVFGALVEQRTRNQTADQADWLIGREILADGVSGDALRSMKAPGTAYDDDLLGKDPQPDHMDNFVTTVDDNGGVHINSGIPNRAFYEIAIELGGNSWDRAGRIHYATLGHSQLRETSNFRRFARLNRQVARDIFGHGSAEESAVEGGWAKVGVEL